MNEQLSQQIQLLKSVFKGRDDVFAVRWEKGNKSGYMPACFYDPYRLANSEDRRREFDPVMKISASKSVRKEFTAFSQRLIDEGDNLVQV